MHAQDAIDRLAELAHDLWRDGMEGSGWSHGVYDPRSRTHDALVAFSQLPVSDRRRTRTGVRALECLEDLAGAVEYARGPARPFTLDEMREGLPVALAPTDSRVRVHARGAVSRWDHEAGELVSITVRWNDGEETTHLADAGELMRLDERPREQ